MFSTPSNLLARNYYLFNFHLHLDNDRVLSASHTKGTVHIKSAVYNPRHLFYNMKISLHLFSPTKRQAAKEEHAKFYTTPPLSVGQPKDSETPLNVEEGLTQDPSLTPDYVCTKSSSLYNNSPSPQLSRTPTSPSSKASSPTHTPTLFHIPPPLSANTGISESITHKEFNNQPGVKGNCDIPKQTQGEQNSNSGHRLYNDEAVSLKDPTWKEELDALSDLGRPGRTGGVG